MDDDDDFGLETEMSLRRSNIQPKDMLQALRGAMEDMGHGDFLKNHDKMVKNHDRRKRRKEYLDAIRLIYSRRANLSLSKQMAIAVLKGDTTAALALADRLIEERKANY
jgi:hypothetical protein